jgi:protein-S-isoprenylcysteine O-methyltransferase Ste14
MSLRQVARDPWVWGQFLLAGGLLGLAAWDPAPAGVHRWVGAAIALAGLGMASWGVSSLGPNLTPTVVPRSRGELVDRGAYAHARHPIYTGMIALLTGLTLTLGGWRFGLGALASTGLYFDRKAAAEERLLLARYPQYEAYRARVPKLIPRL